jgi:hypothetical protein
MKNRKKKSPTSASHVGDSPSTSASHVEDHHSASASHARGTSPITSGHTSNMYVASASHVINPSPTSTSHVGDMQPATAIHARGIDFVEKPRRIGCKPKFPCNLCKGDHLTHLCPAIPKVQRLWSLSARYFDSKSFEVSSQPIQLVVEKLVMPIQSSTNPTPILGGEVPLDHVVSQPIHPLVAKVVMSMQSLADPTPLLGGEVPLDHVVS